MKPTTIKALQEFHIKDPICMNCLSEEFDHFSSFNGQVLFCENCCNWMKVTVPQIDLKFINNQPTL